MRLATSMVFNEVPPVLRMLLTSCPVDRRNSTELNCAFKSS